MPFFSKAWCEMGKELLNSEVAVHSVKLNLRWKGWVWYQRRMSGAKLPVDDLSRDELIKLVRMQADAIKKLEKQVEDLSIKLKQRNPTERLDQPYSQKGEEQRNKLNNGKKNRKKKKPSKRRKGRITTAEKIKQAQRTERVYPDDVEPTECMLSHTRVAWRLEDGRLFWSLMKFTATGISMVVSTVSWGEVSLESRSSWR